jgi:hypothetical protein
LIPKYGGKNKVVQVRIRIEVLRMDDWTDIMKREIRDGRALLGVGPLFAISDVLGQIFGGGKVLSAAGPDIKHVGISPTADFPVFKIFPHHLPDRLLAWILVNAGKNAVVEDLFAELGLKRKSLPSPPPACPAPHLEIFGGKIARFKLQAAREKTIP